MSAKLAVLGLCCAVCAACGDGSPETARAATAETKPAEPAVPDPRADYVLTRSLLGEASRAELRAGGVVIDFGTADQHKYTRGGWDTGWGDPAEDEGVTYAEISGDRAALSAFLIEPPKQLALRGRAAGEGETVELAVEIDGERVGAVELGGDWSVARVELPERERGRVAVELACSRGEGCAEIDWLRVGAAGAPDREPGPRIGPARLGGRVRRALLAPGARSYSFYLDVREGTSLLFDYGAMGQAVFRVRAEKVDGEIVELAEHAATEQWQTAEVDLAPVAGETVRLELSVAGELEAAGWGEPAIYRPRGDAKPARVPAARAKNLVFVLLDTTRADVFEPFAPGNRVHTPVLDGLAARGTAFTAAYNNGNWTKPSVATILSGLYPETHTVLTPASIVPDDALLLSEHLDEHGFATGAFIANGVVTKAFGYDQGWDTFANYSDDRRANAKRLYPLAAEWLEQHADERFFLWVQSVEPHTAYNVPREYSSRYHPGGYSGPIGRSFGRDEQKAVNQRELKLSRRDIDWIRALYDGEVSYQDEYLGALFAKLDELELWDDTIVVVTNDHGEELHEHGNYGHGWTLYEEIIRAPLVIHYPPLVPAETVVPEVVEHVDLAPTLVEALGVPPMPDTEGVSMLDRLHGAVQRPPGYAVSYSENGKRSVRVGRWKLMLRANRGWERLYDLSRPEPEGDDLRKTAALAGRMCEVYLGEALATPRKLDRGGAGARRHQFEARDLDLDPKTRKRLEALGYL